MVSAPVDLRKEPPLIAAVLASPPEAGIARWPSEAKASQRCSLVERFMLRIRRSSSFVA
jgi:hypothetical protein